MKLNLMFCNFVSIFFFSFTHTHSRVLCEFCCVAPYFTATDSDRTFPRQLSPEVLQALRGVRFIAQHIKDADKDNEVGIVYVPCVLFQLKEIRIQTVPISMLTTTGCNAFSLIQTMMACKGMIRLDSC